MAWLLGATVALVVAYVLATQWGWLPRAQVVEKLKAAKIAFASVNSVADLVGHPALRLVPVETPEGAVEIVAPAAIVDGMTPGLKPVPAIGQHSEAIRQEFAA